MPKVMASCWLRVSAGVGFWGEGWDGRPYLHSDEGTADFGRCQFGVVEWDDHGEGADSYTCDETAGEDVVLALTSGAGLYDDTETEDT